MQRPITVLLLLLSASSGACHSPHPSDEASNGERGALRRFEERRVAMGVQARVVVCAHSAQDAALAFTAAFASIESVEAALSDWRTTSELSQLNASAGGPAMAVSPHLFAALDRSLAIARASGGAFDPTVGPLTQLWRDARNAQRLPDESSVEAALARCGWQNVELESGAHTARLREAGMRLDLGAIGKGFACDEALLVLRAKGFPAALVEIGGDLAAGDPPPGETAWLVAAGGHTAAGARIAPGTRIVGIAREGMATSGDGEQRLEIGGVRYSHVIDPRTGMGVRGGVATTVIARDGATADALATAASVLGARAGRALVEREGGRLFVDDPARTVLFDGRSLEGWVTKGGRYDGGARWKAEPGCIVGRVNERGEGGLLYTEKEYTSFVFECEVKVDQPFDSGIFVRMQPPETGLKGAQVTLDDRPGGEIAAIYSDGFLLHNEAASSAWRVNAWNHVEVRVTGFDMRIETWLNGAKVTDHQVPASPQSIGTYAPSGRIGLQVHGGMGEPPESAARFREIRIRELPLFGDESFEEDERGFVSLTDEGERQGWQALFDGRSLEGWEEHGSSGAWRARDRVLGGRFGQEAGELRTKEDFRDFALRLDFKTARMANSGVFLRAARDESNPAFSGCEVQILDDFDWERETKTTLKNWQFSGSLYGAVPPAVRDALKPVGEWNSFEILYRGPRLAVALNGRTLYDVDTTTLSADPPFAERAEQGFIGLQRYVCDGPAAEDAVSFRNVFVRR